jgi:transposase
VPPLLADLELGGLIADAAFDATWILEELDARGAKIVIAQHPRRTQPRPVDKDLYRWRHLIENFFAKLKWYRAIATRYDKRAVHFLGAIHLAAAIIWLN